MKKDIIEIGRLLYQKDYITATDGNISIVINSGNLLITPTGARKERLTEHDLIVIDRQGKKIEGQGEPSMEMWMHIWIYNRRPDIKAVIHAHPPYSTAYSFIMPREYKPQLPETEFYLSKIGFIPYREPGSKELAELVKEKIVDTNTLILQKHGVISTGVDIWDAFNKLERLEFEMKIRILRRMSQ